MVKPLELANLCSLYNKLRKVRFEKSELITYLKRSLLIDTNSSPLEIIECAVNFNLIVENDSLYSITKEGRKLGKLQILPTIYLKDNIKKLLIKECYLNSHLKGFNCEELVLKFEPDSNFETFIYKREHNESLSIINWLKVLSSVDFIYSKNDLILVSKEYLAILNKFLKIIRNENDTTESIKEDKRNVIGEIAEISAFEYEIERLKNNGYPDLTKLVQRISKIDNTAGYDIISCQGTGKYPENRRYIEVKGTEKSYLQFIWSRNERRVAKKLKKSYWLYCFTSINIQNNHFKGPFKINNPIINLAKLNFQSEPDDILYYKR